jgi:putative flippase GtrA
MSASGANAVGLELERSQAHRPPSQSRKQLTRFLFVGGSSVAVDLVCYTLLLGRLDRVTAKGIAYAVGVLVGFAGNKLWTFESRRKSYTEPAIYVFVYGITLVLNMAINSLVCDIVTPWIRSDTTTQFLAFLIATGVTTVLNFLGLKYFAFRQSQIQSA